MLQEVNIIGEMVLYYTFSDNVQTNMAGLQLRWLIDKKIGCSLCNKVRYCNMSNLDFDFQIESEK